MGLFGGPDEIQGVVGWLGPCYASEGIWGSLGDGPEAPQLVYAAR